MKQPLLVPRMNPNDDQVEIVHWSIQTGESIRAGAPLCEFATSKANFVFEAPSDGFVQVLRQKGDRARIGEVFGQICTTAAEARELGGERETASGSSTFSQRARDLMRTQGLGENDFAGLKYVTEKDVLRKARGQTAKPISLAKEAEISVLSQAYRTALRSSLTIHIPAAPVLEKIKSSRVGMAAALAFASAQAIVRNPWILDQLESTSTELSLNYALDMGDGVKPLFADNLQHLTLQAWHEKITDWSLRVARHEIEPREIQMGRFTVTDLSALGVFSFEPLLVGEQSAILGLGSDLSEGVMNTLTATLAFDHRIHSGRQGALFLQDFRTLLKLAPNSAVGQ